MFYNSAGSQADICDELSGVPVIKGFAFMVETVNDDKDMLNG